MSKQFQQHVLASAAAAAASSSSQRQQQSYTTATMPRRSKAGQLSSEDDESYVEPSRPSTKRKRALSGSDAASTMTSHHEGGNVLAFPILTDDEPSLTSVYVHTSSSAANSSAPSSPSAASAASSSSSLSLPTSSSTAECVAQSSFHCASKHLFSLTDESRDRGSAKIATITVQLRHPSFAHLTATSPHASASRAASLSPRAHTYISSFKIDGRKSFSNAPFKRYYRRGVHAAWFAESTSQVSFGHSALVGEGRVLMLLSQKAGRPNGKGFTGLKHDPSSHSPKHPLLCLSSNSVEYTVQVFVNLSEARLQDETFDLRDWSEVEVELTARFDAGEVLLQSLTVPQHLLQAQTQAQRQPASLPRSIVQPTRRTPPAITIPPFHQLVAAASPRARTASATTENLSSPASELYVSDETSMDESSSEEEGFSTPRLNEEDTSSSQDSCMDIDEPQHADFYSAEHALAGEAFGVSLPESSKDEFLAEWQWLDAPAAFSTEVAAKCSLHLAAKSSPAGFEHLPLHDMLQTLASPVAMTTVDPSTYPSYELPTAEDFELAQPLLEERSSKRMKLELEQMLHESLFPTHVNDWSASSPQAHFIQPHQMSLVVSPIAEYAHQTFSY
jgi:hypothetical protein